MCGILLLHSQDQRWQKEQVASALSAMKHRGPDASGFWFSDKHNIVLGHQRLAINGGDSCTQPLISKDKKVVVSINGEIYNSRNNISLSTDGDSELLVHLFQNKGIDAFAELDGEFACIVRDNKNSITYLARDRHGIKPLFYAFWNGDLIATSEIGAILALGFPAIWNTRYLAAAEGFTVDASETFVEGIYSLSPGHILSFTGQEYVIQPYTSRNPLRPSEYDTRHMSFEAASDQFQKLLCQAVDKRLPDSSAHSVQTYLSSGIDSSVITAIAARYRDDVSAYSIAFDHFSLDESADAAVIADSLNIRHEIVRVTDQILADCFEESVAHCAMPVPNINVAAKYSLSKVLRKSGHKTVLTGEGADESLLGYSFFAQDLQSPYSIKDLPVSWAGGLADIIAKVNSLPAQIVHAYPSSEVLSQLRSPLYKSINNKMLLPDLSRDGNVINRSQELHYHTVFQTYNLGALADRTEMANSIEGRPPFLDNQFVDFIHTLPQKFLFSDGINKKILRCIAADLLPEKFCRIAKKPFVAPSSSLRSKSALAELFHSLLSGDDALPQFYDKDKVLTLFCDALTFSDEKKACFDPIFTHLASVAILHKRYHMIMR